MRNILFALLSFIIIAGLVACDGEEVQDKDVSSVESSNEENEAAAAEEETEEEEEAVKEFNKEIIDNDSVKATLVSVEHIVDKDWDEEKYDIKFEVENKMDDTVEVQAREVSADGKMVDESMLMMSQEISGGKVADAVLTIESFEGDDLPDMEEDLEMILHVFSWEDMEQEENIDVNIEF
ncbi:hypothetical protein KQI49_02485 [Virgibacillus sp. MSJ-26]|uniref:hypothetical protein n=1 Tax=Virgibacillus sp. MSJ-26 TaxID=2841522 RepID=UPI001C112AA9|nr:hypothetical protein [Virgibacillus sp. MSJ-26]MBU5465694.1 hypothetical protein [Virgibacillus sp. MSJ-26]